MMIRSNRRLRPDGSCGSPLFTLPIHSFLIPLQIKEVHFSKSCGQVNGTERRTQRMGEGPVKLKPFKYGLTGETVQSWAAVELENEQPWTQGLNGSKRLDSVHGPSWAFGCVHSFHYPLLLSPPFLPFLGSIVCVRERTNHNMNEEGKERRGTDQSPNVHFISLTYIRFICSIS